MYTSAQPNSAMPLSNKQALQLLEKAQNYTEDDDLLSPFDTGDVERQIKHAWWKTCTLFTFLFATLGMVMFIIIRDNNNNNNNKNNNKNNISISSSTSSSSVETLIKRGEIASSKSVNIIGLRSSIHNFYETEASLCVNSMIDAMIDSSELTNDDITMTSINNGFFSLLDSFASFELKSKYSIKDYLSKISELGFFSNKLNKEFPLSSFLINAKSDALIFVMTINWEAMYGNVLPYVTQKTITMTYDFNKCEITNIFSNLFEECFNGKCNEKLERDSVVITYLRNLVKAHSN